MPRITTDIEEQELVRSILNGDKQRYSEIVKKYQLSVAGLCYKLAGEKLDIDEVVQTVFVELYTSLPRFKFSSKLSTYIYRITVNVVSKMLKRNGRIARINDYALDNVSQQKSAEDNIIADDSMSELNNALAQLKIEQHTALTLFYYKNLSYKEIAEVMNISLAKTESLIYRAKQNIKNQLDKNNQNK